VPRTAGNAARNTHQDREPHFHHERCPADLESEPDLPERRAHGRRGHTVGRQGEQATQRAADDGQER